MARLGENGVDQPGMIEHGIARLQITEEIDQGNAIRLRTRQRSHDEIEIGSGEALPTIRPDHRVRIMSIAYAGSKLALQCGSLQIERGPVSNRPQLMRTLALSLGESRRAGWPTAMPASTAAAGRFTNRRDAALRSRAEVAASPANAAPNDDRAASCSTPSCPVGDRR